MAGPLDTSAVTAANRAAWDASAALHARGESWDEAIVYDGQTAPAVPPSYWFVHTMGAIVNAIVDAGLVLTRLDEFAHSNSEVEYDKYEKTARRSCRCGTC